MGESNQDVSRWCGYVCNKNVSVPMQAANTDSHIHPDKVQWATYQGPRRHQLKGQVSRYDIVLTTYDTVRSDRTREEPCLFEQKWARVVLDEGLLGQRTMRIPRKNANNPSIAHRIRNRSSKLFSDVGTIPAECRWCLTGTPIQNRLDDFGALLEFLQVPDLNSRGLFQKYIENSMNEKKKEGLAFLRDVVSATCLRRTKADHALTLNLPRKIERIESVEMDRSTRELYEFFKRFSYEAASASRVKKKRSSGNILVLISMLRLICDHGEALLSEAAVTAWKQKDTKALTWEMLKSSTKRCISCDDEIEDLDMGDSPTEGLSCGHLVCETCETKSQGSSGQVSCPLCGTTAPSSPSKRDDSRLSPSKSAPASPKKRQWSPSAKVEALLRNISASQTALDLGTHPGKR